MQALRESKAQYPQRDVMDAAVNQIGGNSKPTKEDTQPLCYLENGMNMVPTNRVFILSEVMCRGIENRPFEIYNEALINYKDR